MSTWPWHTQSFLPRTQNDMVIAQTARACLPVRVCAQSWQRTFDDSRKKMSPASTAGGMSDRTIPVATKHACCMASVARRRGREGVVPEMPACRMGLASCILNGDL